MTVPIRCPNPDCGALGEGEAGRPGRCHRCGRDLDPAAATAAPGGPDRTSAWEGPPTATAATDANASTDADAGGPPGRFGRYEIRGRLGRGGMGAVYLARDTKLGRDVALKVPSFAPGDGVQAIRRFEREARAAATLDHPNLCPVFDVGEVDGVPFLTMPYIAGEPLAAGRLPEAEAVAAARTIARAMQEAHDRGVVHRDLKPGNVLVNRRGELVVVDFGLARLDDAGEAPITRSGLVSGTVAYMAPEQAAGGDDAARPAVDIYALGVILYELLAGARPFDGPWALVVGLKSVRDPDPPSARRPGLHPALDALCLRALARDPADRYRSMAEFAAALDEFLATATVTTAAAGPARDAAPSSATTTARPTIAATAALPGRRGPSRRRRWAAPIAGAALLVAGLGAVLLTRPDRGPGRPAQARPPAAPAAPSGRPGRFEGAAAIRGDWDLDDGELRQKGRAAGPGSHPLLLLDTPDLSSYDFTLQARKDDGDQGFLVLFHGRDGRHYGEFGLGTFGNKSHSLRYQDDGPGPDESIARCDGSIKAGRWYDLKLEVRGPRCRCFLDGDLLFDRTNPGWDRGRIGLATAGTAARFRRLRATAPDGRVLYEGLPDLPDD